jgi:hypothetical protein
MEEKVRRAFHQRGLPLDPSEDLWSIIAHDSRFIIERTQQGTEETVRMRFVQVAMSWIF